MTAPATMAPDTAFGDAPFLYLRQRSDGVEPQGSTSVVLGHPVPGIGPRRDGIFAEWHWDGSGLTIANDRYGCFPLFYASGDHGFALSPSIPRLAQLGVPMELDWDALSVFVRLGFFIGDDTPFRAVRAMPPAAATFDDGGTLRVEGTTHFARVNSISRDDAIDAFIALFGSAMAKRLPPDQAFTLPLSGGKDSRHILLELARLGMRPASCATVQLPTSEDVEVARLLADALGVHHTVLRSAASRLHAELRKNVLTNFCADEHGWFLTLADHLRGRTSVVYDGIGGDVLTGRLFLSPERLGLFAAGRLEELARGLWSRQTEKVLQQALHPDAYARLRPDTAVERLVAELARHAGAPNPVSSFFFNARTRREIALSPFALLENVGPVHCPFLDHDVYDLLVSLPADMLLDGTFHTAAISRAYPDFAHIPFGGSVHHRGSMRRRLRFASELTHYTLTGGASGIVRRRYAVTRAIRQGIDPRYHWSGRLVVLLLQLGRFAQSR